MRARSNNVMALMVLAAGLLAAQVQPLAKPNAGHLAASPSAAAHVPAPSRAPVGHSEPTDPDAYARNIRHMPSWEEAMRNKVNPCGIDYGKIFSGWQDVVVENTISSLVWWCAFLSILGLAGAFAYIWFLKAKERNMLDCFARAARILIGQRTTAYQSAQSAIQKHNSLVERYDTLYLAQSQIPEIAPLPEAVAAQAAAVAAPAKQQEAEGGVTELQLEDGAEMEESFTAAGERVFSIKGVRYIEYEHHQRKVRALETKINSQRTTINQLKEKKTNLEATLENLQGARS